MTRTVSQPSLAPTRKVAASGVTGLVTLLLVWAANRFLGYELDPEAAAALVLLASSAVGYFTKSRAPTFTDGAQAMGAPPPTRLRRDPGDD